MADDFDGFDAPPPADKDAPNVTPIGHARRRKRRSAKQPGDVLTQLDVSERFVRRFGGSELRYCAALGGWHCWTGTHWARDEREHSRECAKEIARELVEEAARDMDRDSVKVAFDSAKASGVSATLALARSAPEVVFTADDADRDPWLLNCRNGTLDLRTGDLRPHDRADLITRVCPVDYDAQAEAPTFQRFLAEVQPDPEVRAYLARVFGYAAVGVVRDHVLIVLWGPGRNGKGVLAGAVTHALGSYANTGPRSLVIQNGAHEPHPTDVASLVGRRLVFLHETTKGGTFDASKTKTLTGGDPLPARFMRQDFFTFEPSHTLVMLTNYRPKADASDSAMWRRIQLVHCNVTIPKEREDTELPEKLKAEAPGVLRWIVEGAREWDRTGLAPPEVVRKQTEAYRASEDLIGEFLDERTVRLPEASVKAGALYDAYKAWCASNGHEPVRGNEFFGEVQDRGFERGRRSSSGRTYRGLGLRESKSEDDE